MTMSQQSDYLQLDKRGLQDRIQRFYGLLNDQQWEKCFEFVDPRLREDGKVTLDTYVETLSSFFAAFGPLEEMSVTDLTLYSDVRTSLYDDRDFAQGCVVWKDREQRIHKLQERWVKAADGNWYTRMVGLV